VSWRQGPEQRTLIGCSLVDFKAVLPVVQTVSLAVLTLDVIGCFPGNVDTAIILLTEQPSSVQDAIATMEVNQNAKAVID
jgi:hypothetical protein